ncbi:SDR family oxidoreductase [Phenylobacterium sp. LjRoot219]|uniref:SDR family NAD(P)-dependent oxidoreductase n=1 Tax=Phenylobacterium sp. LjRoot219 TaxID=3342283 RepID=UPI003ECD5A34
MTGILKGKTALVTGGSRGLGRAMSERLAASGALVAVNYAGNAAAAEETVATIAAAGGQAFAVRARLGEADANETLVEAMTAEFRRRTGQTGLDILVNNIGGGDYGSIATVTAEQYDQTFANNVRSPFFLTQALLPHLRDGGRVINISSSASRLAGVDFIVYSMSKAALDMFTRVLAKDLGASKRITVNSVLPGFNETETNEHLANDPQARRQIEEMTALGRFGRPMDIAEVVHFLASPAGGWVTGQIIEASGGFRL